MIEARALNKTYRDSGKRVTVFQGLNLRCNAGEYVALMGPSGAGKTSLLQLLGCLDRPNTGEYFLDGQQVSHLEEEELAHIRNEKIGFVFQTNHFVEYLDLVENIALPGLYRGDNDARAISKRATSLLSRVGLSHRLHHLPRELSGGERQRAAIARALFNHPGLILADEPTGNLDAANTARVLEILEELHEAHITVILVTHDSAVASRAHRVLHLCDGQLREQA